MVLLTGFAVSRGVNSWQDFVNWRAINMDLLARP
jgi:hypothetical protein